MIVGIQGTNSFDNYQTFMRGMGVAMSAMSKDDKEFYIYTAGPARVNSFVAEFSNITERSLKSRGIKIRFFKIPPTWIEENVEKLNYFMFFSKPGEHASRLTAVADLAGVEVGIFKF